MVAKWQKVGEPTDASESRFGKKLVRQYFLDPKGERQEFIFYALKDSMVVLIVTDNNKVLVVREYQQGADRVQENLVGGLRNGDESLEETARREALEETGYQIGQLVPLGYMPIIARHSSARVDLFLATGCTRVPDHEPDPSEELEIVEYDLEEWLAKVMTEDIDGFSTTATMRSLPHLGLTVRPK